MIPAAASDRGNPASKPRASGDDPATGRIGGAGAE